MFEVHYVHELALWYNHIHEMCFMKKKVGLGEVENDSGKGNPAFRKEQRFQ